LRVPGMLAGDPSISPIDGRPSDETMVKNMTRSRVIQFWFAAVLLIVVACVAFGVAMTISTGAMLLVMSLVPPAIVLLLWPGAQAATIGDVLRGTKRRG
jgi:hypothetical protein